ncbi:MAG: AzlD domain-containing protein [Actinomycetota bacterium]|jgi:branched-subunit amino acid transport protein|nr:AzlD domain-containing protein [Actinomycetota bacterium]
MSADYIWAVIAGMAVANFAVRFVPVAVISRIDLPTPIMRWLRFVPVSVMGSLIALEVLRPGGEYQAPWDGAHLPAALVSMIVYRLTKSFMGASVAGVVAFIVLRGIIG